MTATNGRHLDNGSSPSTTLRRAEEVHDLIEAVRGLIVPFIKAADDAASQRATGDLAPGEANVLVDFQKPRELVDRIKFSLPNEGQGKGGLLEIIQQVLQNSVNTWDQGFLDKLYASTNAVGVVSDMVLSVLNTNLHVFQVSPALTVIEKITAKTLAHLFGFTGPRAGGISCQGGSASNLTSLVVARNTLFPECRISGNGDRDFVVFTSAHGHYSVEKSAMICGLGSSSVWPVAVDEYGCMKPDALREQVLRAKAEGKTPFYVNSTAGTTVMGSYEPFEEISKICKEFGLWMHIDASWGGPAIFSAQQKSKLNGSHLADSLTVNPHKMMNVPVTCSFLLGPDMNIFNKANSTAAGYLFHTSDSGDIWDLADLTLQCGRRGDSLKLALAWIYYGATGFEKQIDHAFEQAAYLASLIKQSDNFVLVSQDPPPCLQVCFYYAPGGDLSEDKEVNTLRTKTMVEKMILRGYMVDYAPGPKGSFFRVVVNCQTLKGTVEGLVKGLEEVGRE
ncbi:L-aspartate decarboxylase dtxS4 [Fusarium floridanum]|uniref:L-aspartate decarboxylase dtxS4 n=1 Tax=Fusarium floridanum TaxID=1325733 RepID=A0A428RLY9_9HYPO|nr:L-aspartate decarboxylase dtxS4 [Fusarium floridanum]